MSTWQSTQIVGTQAVGTHVVGTAVEVDGKTKRSLFVQWFEALTASRMRKAEREIKEHLRFVPDHLLRQAGYRRREPD